MAQKNVGNLTFETSSQGAERTLRISTGPDVFERPVTTASLNEAAESIRVALNQFAEVGPPRIYEFKLNAGLLQSNSSILTFRLSATGEQRNLDVVLHGYRSIAYPQHNFISTGQVSPAVLEDLATWLES